MSSEGKNLLHEEENEYLDGKTFTSASTLSKIVCNSSTLFLENATSLSNSAATGGNPMSKAQALLEITGKKL
ncbi:hypothetical protein JHK85_043617 [Glycine max]|nr:hypothetical protein JHK85_043617 [Glycine max]